MVTLGQHRKLATQTVAIGNDYLQPIGIAILRTRPTGGMRSASGPSPERAMALRSAPVAARSNPYCGNKEAQDMKPATGWSWCR